MGGLMVGELSAPSSPDRLRLECGYAAPTCDRTGKTRLDELDPLKSSPLVLLTGEASGLRGRLLELPPDGKGPCHWGGSGILELCRGMPGLRVLEALEAVLEGFPLATDPRRSVRGDDLGDCAAGVDCSCSLLVGSDPAPNELEEPAELAMARRPMMGGSGQRSRAED
jgi:hypothetical protein